MNLCDPDGWPHCHSKSVWKLASTDDKKAVTASGHAVMSSHTVQYIQTGLERPMPKENLSDAQAGVISDVRPHISLTGIPHAVELVTPVVLQSIGIA
jgi:hypothetical protein